MDTRGENLYHVLDPLLLYFAQLSAAAILAVIQHSQTPKNPRAGNDGPRTDCAGRDYLMGICVMCFSALAMVCMLQAILHNKNLPALVMLTVGGEIVFAASSRN